MNMGTEDAIANMKNIIEIVQAVKFEIGNQSNAKKEELKQKIADLKEEIELLGVGDNAEYAAREIQKQREKIAMLEKSKINLQRKKLRLQLHDETLGTEGEILRRKIKETQLGIEKENELFKELNMLNGAIRNQDNPSSFVIDVVEKYRREATRLGHLEKAELIEQEKLRKRGDCTKEEWNVVMDNLERARGERRKAESIQTEIASLSERLEKYERGSIAVEKVFAEILMGNGNKLDELKEELNQYEEDLDAYEALKQKRRSNKPPKIGHTCESRWEIPKREHELSTASGKRRPPKKSKLM